MAMYKRLLLAGTFASALLLGACGDDEKKADDAKTEDAATTEEETTEEETEEE